tara:strand:+ start:10159 stop:11127 length:969 start_codon:yes stop_codon:yes gene_type:complete
MKYKVVIIGLGNIGLKYDFHIDSNEIIQTHFKAFTSHDNFEIVGVVEIDKENINLFKKKFDLDIFNDINECIRCKKPHVIVIATPTETHRIIIEKIENFNSQLKLILCEKPISYSISDAEKIIQKANNLSVKLYINYMRRVDPGAIEIKKRIENYIIESPLKGSCFYTKGIYNNCSHFINLLEFWLGDSIESSIIKKCRMWNGFDPEYDFVVKFEKGEIVFRSLWEEKYSHYSIDLYSKNGHLCYADGGYRVTWRGVITDPIFQGYNILNSAEELIDNQMNISQMNVVKEIFNVLNNEKSNLCTGEQALSTIRLIENLNRFE